MSDQSPLRDREPRPGKKGFLRWLRVGFAMAWALSFAFALVVVILRAQQGSIDWLLLFGLIVLGGAMLPFGLFILRRIEAVLSRSTANNDVPAEISRNQASGRTVRLLTGLFGLVLVSAGLVGGLHGKLYEGRNPIRSVDAPVTAWILGAILIVVGLCLISVVFSKPPREHSDQ